MISLAKTILPGSFRYLGQQVDNAALLDIPIGGATMAQICSHVGGTLHAVGRTSLADAFVIERPPFRLLYVRPDFKGYRRVAEKLFRKYNWAVDYDHTLGKKMAVALGCRYVLMIRANPSVNRANGRFEHAANLVTGAAGLCFVNSRIANKFIARPPAHMPNADTGPYDFRKREQLGWTLKQAGQWAHAIGMEDSWSSNRHLVAVPPPP